MKEYVIGLPVKKMKAALAAVANARVVHDAVDAEIAALPALNAVEHGTLAIKKREELLAALKVRKDEATKKAVAEIDSAKAACFAAIDKQTVPSGADITGANEADFKLLEYGLVETLEHLTRLAEAHNGAPAFRAMVRKYAKQREWDGFTFHDKEESLRAFADDFMDQCYKAARSPRGYYGLLLEQDTELERQALAAGLVYEYQKGLDANI